MIHRFLSVASLFVMLGGLFLVWYYLIDGVYVNKTIVYREDINPDSLVLDKKEYKRGEIPQYRTAFCKNREAVGTITWVLVNQIQVAYSPKQPYSVPVGCYPHNGDYVWIATEPIVESAKTGCDHYFAANIKRDYGNRIENATLKTESFCVTD